MNFLFRSWENNRGLILIGSIILVAVIAILTTSLFARTAGERMRLNMESNRIISFNLAESGIDEAITHLEFNANYSGTGTTLNLGGGQYTTVVSQPDIVNNPHIRQIISTGYAPNNQGTSPVYQERTITAYVTLDQQPNKKSKARLISWQES